MWGSAKAARCKPLWNWLLQEMPSSLAAMSMWICGTSLNPVRAPGAGLTPRRSRTSPGQVPVQWAELPSTLLDEAAHREDLWVNAPILLLVPAVLLDIFSLVELQESN